MNKHQLISTHDEDWLNEVITSANSQVPAIIDTSSHKPNRELFLKLYRNLDNHYFSYKDWYSEIWIKNGIKTKTVLENKDLFIKAAMKFKETANFLMQKLKAKYNVDFESGDGINDLRILNNHENKISDIDEQWRFNFHGYECLISNTDTEQLLDIIFITRPEFGVLDPFFFLQYVNTTPEWIALKELLEDDYEATDQALLTLEAYGYMDRILDDDFSSRGLIAK